MAAGRVTQSAAELVTLNSPSALVTQSAVEIIALPGSPPPPTPTPVVPVSPVGGPQPFAVVGLKGKQGCPTLTPWDLCLLKEIWKWKHIDVSDPCLEVEKYRNLLPWDDDFAAIPAQARPFRQAGGIVTPSTASGDNIVTSFTVPSGYDGILSGVFWFYSSTGFQEGSGDIIWRIQINRRYVKDLSNTPFQLGSPVFPLPLTEGQLLVSRQRVNLIVNVPNLSGLINIGASSISGALFGFVWPRPWPH